MHEFDYCQLPASVFNQENVSKLLAIQELKGRYGQVHLGNPPVLEALRTVALVQSAEASNSLEGIRTSDKRLRQIVSNAADPKSRAEEEIAGYRDVLNTIHQNHAYLELTPNLILQLHRDLYRYTASSLGGRFKVGDNEIRGMRPDGSECVRFRPVSAVATPDAVERLCVAFRRANQVPELEPLALLRALMFVFDFTCIHPFNDGNGRMSRLLTVQLLYQTGHFVGRYVSIEQEIERTKGAYYDALAASSEGWDAQKNDPGPFVRYMLGVILAAYRQLDSRLSGAMDGASKPQRVEAFLRGTVGKASKRDIMDANPDISVITVERTLRDLLDQGKLRKVGSGRSTGYVYCALEL